MYARFLEEAESILGLPALAAAARAYAASAEHWSQIARAALPDEIPELAAIRVASEAQSGPAAAAARDRDAGMKQSAAAALTDARAQSLAQDLSKRIRGLHTAESQALQALADAVA
jgi:hypothetical protein